MIWRPQERSRPRPLSPYHDERHADAAHPVDDYFADLDVSVIDELPPGRAPVVTKLVADDRRSEIIARIQYACRQGKQVYWVCPLIEESDTLQLQTAMETYENLRQVFPDLNVGLVHGRLPTQEKTAVMASFKQGDIQLLIATTVIEVGVDVPNASLMVIENAERMGYRNYTNCAAVSGADRKPVFVFCCIKNLSQTLPASDSESFLNIRTVLKSPARI